VRQIQNNVLTQRHLTKKFILIKQLSTNLLSQKKFSKKNYFFFNYKKFIFNSLNSKFIKKIKFRYYNKNISKINILQNVVLRYHGLIFIKNKILKESLEQSSRDDGSFCKDDSVIDYKVNRNVNSQCIVLPTGVNSLAHYLFESITKLYNVKNNKNIKVIINDKISNDIVDILLNYGIKKKQILIKPILENWKIKELIFPILSYFEISQDECNFLSEIIKKNIFSYIWLR